ncbi:MAG: hypothetical protein AVDCRST_MAG29-146, partial [uncultured Nocardioidaceae bacterium]
ARRRSCAGDALPRRRYRPRRHPQHQPRQHLHHPQQGHPPGFTGLEPSGL